MIRLAAFSFLIALSFASPALALKISPFKLSITPEKAAEGTVFRVENNSPESAAVQISAMTWDVSPDGTERNDDAEKDFVIFPAQVVLKPHESRAVRVQYVGPVVTGAEKPYRLVAEQLPIGLRDSLAVGSAVRFMLKFKAAFYIAPEKATSAVSVAGLQMTENGKVRVTLKNTGAQHAIIQNPRLSLISEDGKTTVLLPEQLVSMTGENVHAGRERYFDIIPPPGRDTEWTRAELALDPDL